MKLDAARSRLTVSTFAEGLFSKLAHDLELVAGDVTGEATESSAALRIPVASIRVSGVVKKGKLDTAVLSAADRATIERQIRDEILSGTEVTAHGARDGERVSIDVKGARGSTRVACPIVILVTRLAEGDATKVKGSVELSLSSIGCPPVKGPMGAFRVADRVRVDFDLTFV